MPYNDFKLWTRLENKKTLRSFIEAADYAKLKLFTPLEKS